MQKYSFVYDIKTKVYFGAEQMIHLGEEVANYGNKVLFLYDGDYIKKNGIYDLVIDASRKYNFEIVEFTSIKPNPRHTDVQAGVDLCKKEHCNVILAVGGGSTIDSAKVISSCALLDAPVWDVVIGKVPTQGSLPLLTISTISATGSEMNTGGVISNLDTKDKQSLRRPSQRPRVTFLNPEYTFTVPKYQTACGTVDILCHAIETYFSDDEPMMLTDTFLEGLIRTVVHYGPIAYKDPQNEEARANLMWSAPWAINDFLRYDKRKTWSMHPFEHELSAFFDITHGLGLAILMPRYLRHVIDEKSLPRFRNLGIYAFDLDRNLEDQEIAEKVIKKIENLCYETFGLESHLSNLGITEEHFEEIAEKLATDHGFYTAGYRKMSKDELIELFNECL